MGPLTSQNIESELSYAYLHAVASKAGVGCKIGSRHDDNSGVDAILTGLGICEGMTTEVDIKIQLKATTIPPAERGNVFSFPLNGISRYDDLRSKAMSIPRILMVLFLPKNPEEWLTLDDDALILRKCAYWVSLRGALPSENTTSQTVYLPKNQIFSPDSLKSLLNLLSSRKYPEYEGKEL